MSISLAALEAALSEIEQLGHDETTFDVGGTTITMRSLTPEQEVEVQQFAAQAWTEEHDNDAGETLSFVDRFRVETIARALIAVGDLDLRDAEYLETGEVLPNGKAVKEPRHVVLRRIVLRWGGPIRVRIFKRYAAMLKQLAKKAERAIEFEPTDTESEVNRLKARLTELEKELESEKETDAPSMVAHIAEYGEVDESVRKSALEQAVPPSPPAPTDEPRVARPTETQAPVSPVLGPSHTVHRQAPPPQNPPQRQPILPQAAAPPQPTSREPAPPVPHAPQAQGPPAIQTMDGGSFIGPDDINAAVAEANQQLAAARAARGGPAYPPAESALSMIHAMRPQPPHIAAAAVASDMQEMEVGHQEMLRHAGQTPDGVAVFELGQGQEISLDPRANKRTVARNPVARPDPAKGTGNPRFQPRR